jgi:hypothetical protein
MKNEIEENPFAVSGYFGAEYFCDREKETKKIISALQNGRNISLISPRRLGKTGLIHHVFSQIGKKDKKANCFYFDIFATQNLSDFVSLFAQTVLGKLDTFSQKTMKTVLAILKNLRPVFSLDPVSGEQNVRIEINSEDAKQSLNDIFLYLKQSDKRCYIAIDEFQQITEYPEKGVEALLRSYTQFANNIKFIFSGSKKHLMDDIFTSVHRPFYQSTQKVGLDVIPMNIYKEFAKKMFLLKKKTISDVVFEYLYNSVDGHTWYVQYILNRLYELSTKKYSQQDVKKIIDDVLEEENSTYKTYCELLSRGQLRLLTAIAKENKVKTPYEQTFLKKHNLSAVSSVKLALNTLYDKSLILKNDKSEYFVYDRFFSLWLAKVSV